MAQKQLFLLPADIVESQLSMIDLLTAMFPSPGELEIPASTAQCIDKLRNWYEDPANAAMEPSSVPSSLLLAVCLPIAGGDKMIQVNISIPLQCESPDTEQPPPLKYSLRQPEWMSKAEVARLAAAMPQGDVLEAFEYIQEQALHFLEAQQAETSETIASSSEPIVRVWFYFPSLSTREKRDDLVNHGPSFSLTGFVLAGKPGVLCLEGASADIDAYMKFIKTHSWGDIPSHQKKVSERFRETGNVRRVFSGMQEITDSLGERSGQRANRGDMQALEAWLEERGLHEAFEKVIF
ncbi:ubiquitin-conjugating enzyme/RWD-like protein [Aspergillus leporis]|uniref:Ubiquitin-conjugating enzyme/RWD-like protein n=1 Tax=Aspergillus leporis TaxID=41062 RepID=A0A5N5X5J9_9EURO|nr:ubiquitin-conjugating enzyme/RWD-like protein [Aspergillus leporis]